MKAKKSSSENVEQVEQNGNELGNMYCTQEMGKILQSVTLENLSSLGFKEDVWLQYTRILCFAIMSAIGLYGAAFTSIGKNKFILKIVLVAYFTMLSFTLFYDKVILHGSQSRLIGPGNSKFYIWFYLNWRQATFDISYASVGDVAHKDIYKVPLGEAFYEDGKLDDEWYHSSMKKLSKEMEAMISKRLM